MTYKSLVVPCDLISFSLSIPTAAHHYPNIVLQRWGFADSVLVRSTDSSETCSNKTRTANNICQLTEGWLELHFCEDFWERIWARHRQSPQIWHWTKWWVKLMLPWCKLKLYLWFYYTNIKKVPRAYFSMRLLGPSAFTWIFHSRQGLNYIKEKISVSFYYEKEVIYFISHLS